MAVTTKRAMVQWKVKKKKNSKFAKQIIDWHWNTDQQTTLKVCVSSTIDTFFKMMFAMW